jgi:hypothetical protein
MKSANVQALHASYSQRLSHSHLEKAIIRMAKENGIDSPEVWRHEGKWAMRYIKNGQVRFALGSAKNLMSIKGAKKLAVGNRDIKPTDVLDFKVDNTGRYWEVTNRRTRQRLGSAPIKKGAPERYAKASGGAKVGKVEWPDDSDYIPHNEWLKKRARSKLSLARGRMDPAAAMAWKWLKPQLDRMKNFDEYNSKGNKLFNEAISKFKIPLERQRDLDKVVTNWQAKAIKKWKAEGNFSLAMQYYETFTDHEDAQKFWRKLKSKGIKGKFTKGKTYAGGTMYKVAYTADAAVKASLSRYSVIDFQDRGGPRLTAVDAETGQKIGEAQPTLQGMKDFVRSYKGAKLGKYPKKRVKASFAVPVTDEEVYRMIPKRGARLVHLAREVGASSGKEMREVVRRLINAKKVVMNNGVVFRVNSMPQHLKKKKGIRPTGKIKGNPNAR